VEIRTSFRNYTLRRKNGRNISRLNTHNPAGSFGFKGVLKDVLGYLSCLPAASFTHYDYNLLTCYLFNNLFSVFVDGQSSPVTH